MSVSANDKKQQFVACYVMTGEGAVGLNFPRSVPSEVVPPLCVSSVAEYLFPIPAGSYRFLGNPASCPFLSCFSETSTLFTPGLPPLSPHPLASLAGLIECRVCQLVMNSGLLYVLRYVIERRTGAQKKGILFKTASEVL